MGGGGAGWLGLHGISAGHDLYGRDEIWGLDSDGSLWGYDVNGWKYSGGHQIQISAANSDMVFAVTPYNSVQKSVWTYDPNGAWWATWAWGEAFRGYITGGDLNFWFYGGWTY
jgi:hypothetical protein